VDNARRQVSVILDSQRVFELLDERHACSWMAGSRGRPVQIDCRSCDGPDDAVMSNFALERQRHHMNGFVHWTMEDAAIDNFVELLKCYAEQILVLN
jgi:hypothetical protein